MAIETDDRGLKTLAKASKEFVLINPGNEKTVTKLADLYFAINMPARAASLLTKAKALGMAVESGQTFSTEESAGVLGKIVGFFGVKRG